MAFSQTLETQDSTFTPLLPLELIDLCFDYAVPSPTYASIDERYTTLSRLCLVSRSFRQRFQSQLLHTVILTLPKEVQAFLRSPVLNDERRDWVKELKIGRLPQNFMQPNTQRSWDFEVSRLLEACPSLVELYISGMTSVQLQALIFSPSLQRLSLNRVTLSSTSFQSTPALKSLTSLSLHDVTLLSSDALTTGPTLTLPDAASEGWHSFPALTTLSCTPDILRLSNGSAMRGQIAASDYFFAPSDPPKTAQRPEVLPRNW